MQAAKGTAFKFGDDVNTDVILPGKYLNLQDPQQLAQHCMESEDPEFVHKAKPGDIMVAGKNFGCGSSREHAPISIKALGISCVIASTFARIFFRNSINNGLLLIENPDLRDVVTEGEKIEVTVGEKVVCDGKEYPIASLPQNLMDIINAGGLVKAMRQLNGLED